MVKAKKETTQPSECPSFPKEELAGSIVFENIKNNINIK